ncbi:efflux RND transporter periplasmic adaptor subunit [Undibacterium terreum]|uniref:RND transporter n=1 Tax=Undibacterium terreum TaxID=1224302 RepID=A0A916U380_9BURK|nr:efflux RND transporter periplasmic adaptor subunit [Undibacterium terreum]GGC58981.1 RND transporter [Undibacterium terreum]
MLRQTLLAVAITLSLAACSKGADKEGKSADGSASAKTASASASAVALLISPEDLITVQNNSLSSGPVITGSVQPERRADLRAEVSAVVLQVLKENGEAVKRGDLLVRLDDTSIRDSLHSAEAAVRASEQTLDQAERQFQRLKTLRASGMTSTSQLEDAEIRRNNAQSDLVGAKARAAQARQQLQRTEVRAPFEGIVSERKVSAGDTAAIGKELVKVIDPDSMRFEGFVSADRISSVKIGQPVDFRVNGYGQQLFTGKVKRVDPAANATTRQVEVLVNFTDSKQPKVSGLYAEGRIEAATVSTLMIPEAALVRNGDKSFAWRVKDGVVSKISLTLGERDQRRGDYVVRSGLADGDKVVRNPVSTMKDGQKITLAPSATAATAAAAMPSSGASSGTAGK